MDSLFLRVNFKISHFLWSDIEMRKDPCSNRLKLNKMVYFLNISCHPWTYFWWNIIWNNSPNITNSTNPITEIAPFRCYPFIYLEYNFASGVIIVCYGNVAYYLWLFMSYMNCMEFHMMMSQNCGSNIWFKWCESENMPYMLCVKPLITQLRYARAELTAYLLPLRAIINFN